MASVKISKNEKKAVIDSIVKGVKSKKVSGLESGSLPEQESGYLDYLITVILILVVVALVFVSSNKVKEDFTELYFSGNLNLPKYSNGTGEFSFSIHNMENKDYTYDVNVTAEIYNKTNDTESSSLLQIASFSVSLQNNETRTFIQNFSLPPFKKAKLRALIKNQTQDIHFWAFYAKDSIKYENLGLGMLDCLKTVNASSFSSIEINASGSYANGWPTMEVWFDGKVIGSANVTSINSSSYLFPVNGTKGNHVIDIAFVNDAYNATSKEDRNLYIDNVNLDDQKIGIGSFVIDMDENEKAFDCVNIRSFGILYGEAAARVKINSV